VAEILDTDWDVFAHAVDVGFARCVVVGPAFWALSESEQVAILVHEIGHLRKLHVFSRLLLIPVLLCFPRVARRIAREQELSADRFAALHGHALPLLRFLTRVRGDPDRSARIAQLQAILDGGVDA